VKDPSAWYVDFLRYLNAETNQARKSRQMRGIVCVRKMAVRGSRSPRNCADNHGSSTEKHGLDRESSRRFNREIVETVDISGVEGDPSGESWW
jgi:hypothetical protein